MAGIALAASAAAQLVVDAAAFVPLSSQDIKTAGSKGLFLQPRDLLADVVGARALLALARVGNIRNFLAYPHVGIATELNVGAAAGHIGRNGNGARYARLRDDIGLLLVVASVKDRKHLGFGGAVVAGIKRRERVGIGEIMLLPSRLTQHFGELFRLLDRGRADQDRLPALLAVFYQRNDGPIFLSRSAIDLVVIVEAYERHVRRHFEDFEVVDVHELFGFGERRTAHAGELLIHTEVVLESDRCERLVFRLDRLVLFRLERLVQPFGITAARHHASGELVDDDDLAIANNVIFVALE